jgi:hypothetical protein
MYACKLCLAVLKTIILAMATYAIYIYKMKSLIGEVFETFTWNNKTR